MNFQEFTQELTVNKQTSSSKKTPSVFKKSKFLARR